MRVLFLTILVTISSFSLHAQLPKINKGKLDGMKNKKSETSTESKTENAPNPSNSTPDNTETKVADEDLKYFSDRWRMTSSLESDYSSDKIIKNADSLSYTLFAKNKEAFLAKYPTHTDEFYYREVNKFYTEKFSTLVKPKAVNTIQSNLVEIEKKYPSTGPMIKSEMDKTKLLINQCILISPPDKELLDLKNKVDELSARIDEYIKSGGHDKYVAEQNQSRINAVKLDPAKMKDPTVENFIKNNFKVKEFGSPVKINILNSNWEVKTNSLGVPLNKFLFVHVATKKEGKCYFHYLWVRKDHQGGGTYGGMYLDDANVLDEMNCNNIK